MTSFSAEGKNYFIRMLYSHVNGPEVRGINVNSLIALLRRDAKNCGVDLDLEITTLLKDRVSMKILGRKTVMGLILGEAPNRKDTFWLEVKIGFRKALAVTITIMDKRPKMKSITKAIYY